MDRYRYWPILAALLASMTWTMVGPDTRWARLISVALQGSTVLLALARSGRPAGLSRLGGAALGIALAVSALPVLVGAADATGAAAEAVITIAAVLAIASGLVRQLTITVQTVVGALCVYVLLGMVYASLQGVVATVGPHPFFASGAQPDRSDLLYFSFVTLTTVGYGDLVAVSSWGRLLAMIEALNGQLYLVSVVALLVGNIGRTRTPRR